MTRPFFVVAEQLGKATHHTRARNAAPDAAEDDMEAAVATTDTTTPVTTSETTAATPATQEASPSVATSERPKSFEEAFEQVAAKQEHDASASPAPAATAQADATTPAGAPNPSTKKEGPIPFDVHSKALENARTKAADEAVAKYREQYGWAESVPREAVDALPEWSRIAQRMVTDKVGFIRDYIAEVQAQDPATAAQLRSEAGRLLAAGRGAQAQADLSPDVEVRGDNGEVVSRTFSAERVQALIQHAVQDAIGREVVPLKQERAERVAAERATETTRAVNAKADEVIADVHDILEITDPKAEASIALFSAVNDVWTKNPTWTAERAAREVWRTQIRPGLERKAEQTVLDKHKQKAAGNTAKGTGTTTAPQRPRTEKELEQWLQARG